MSPKPKLQEGVDYYVEAGRLVFTTKYHLERGYCCNSKCRHCPYERANGVSQTVQVSAPSRLLLKPLR